jgi:hypothetical protein
MKFPSFAPLLLVLFAALHASPARAGGIFWTNRGAGLLERSGYDGSTRTTIRSNAGTNLRGLWLDLPNNRIYYCDNGADNIHRVGFDNTGFTTLFPTGPSSFPADIEIDPVAGHIYYCDQQKRHIRRTDLTGNNAAILVTDTTYWPYYLDLDFVNRKIYWGDFEGSPTTTGNVFRMNFDGSGRETVVTGNQQTRAVCVDTAGGRLYWVNRNASHIMRCRLSDLPVSATDATKVQTLYTNLDTPHGMVLDIPAGKLYWVDTGTNGKPGSAGPRAISRGDMDGSGPHEILVNLNNEPWDIDVDPRCATYAEWVARYFVRNPGAIAGPAADPDSDGILNVMECALGSHPLRTGFADLPVVTTVSASGGDYPAIRFIRRTGTAGLSVLPQHSFDATSWWDETSPTDGIPQLETVSVTPLPENMEQVVVRSIFPLSNSPRQFLRVQAQLAP